MPHVSKTHEGCYGVVLGDGHCVALVRECCGLPHTSHWRRGDPARGTICMPGTAIATFDDDGIYGNYTDGRSHAAILLAETAQGLVVCDQWKGQSVHERVIRFRDGAGDAVNDGSRFYLIELAD